MIEMIATARFSSPEGSFKPRERFFVTSDERAEQLLRIAVAQRADTAQEVAPSPLPFETKPGPSSSSPAAQASPKPTSKPAKAGPASSSTTDTESLPGQTSSTPATESGGTIISNESAPVLADRGGRKSGRGSARKPRKS